MIYYSHEWVFMGSHFRCYKCGAMDRENTSPPQFGCPVEESDR